VGFDEGDDVGLDVGLEDGIKVGTDEGLDVGINEGVCETNVDRIERKLITDNANIEIFIYFEAE
jgi:hypothetical protein